jgi:hypothetical protein
LKFRIWLLILIVFITATFVVLESYPYGDYRSDPKFVGIEYAALNEKVEMEGMLISNTELSVAFLSYMTMYCSNLKSSNKVCLNKLAVNFENCNNKMLTSINLQQLDSDLMHIEFRMFKVCIV